VVELLDDVPPGVLGFRVNGDVEREDYDNVLRPALERGVQSGNLRTLYLIENIDEIEPSALWADAKLGWDVAIRHRDAWARSAIVTDIEWMARAAKMFLWMIPGEARVFPIAELDQAKAWVAA